MSSIISERELGSRQIQLKHIDGQLLEATVALGCRDWTENQKRNTECRITLKWVDGEIQCVAFNFFESFKLVRKRLALEALYPMCYGSNRNIVVTGMAIDMGLGLKIYKGVKLGSFPTRKQLVSLFASGEDIEPVSVEEQEEFQRQWAESLRNS